MRFPFAAEKTNTRGAIKLLQLDRFDSGPHTEVSVDLRHSLPDGVDHFLVAQRKVRQFKSSTVHHVHLEQQISSLHSNHFRSLIYCTINCQCDHVRVMWAK